MNQGIWRELEDAIRDWSSVELPVCVETGPIFERGRPIARLQTGNRLQVPHAYYAIVSRGPVTDVETIAFIIPNEPARRSFDDVMEFAVSIDAVEGATGLDFLSRLPDQVEQAVEANVAEEIW